MHVWLFELLVLAVAEQMLLFNALRDSLSPLRFLLRTAPECSARVFCGDHWHRHGDIVVAVGENCDLMYGSAV